MAAILGHKCKGISQGGTGLLLVDHDCVSQHFAWQTIEECLLITVISSAVNIHGIQGKEAVAVAAPSPVHAVIVLVGIAVEDKSMAGIRPLVTGIIDQGALGGYLAVEHRMPIVELIVILIRPTASAQTKTSKDVIFAKACTGIAISIVRLDGCADVGHQLCHGIGLLFGVVGIVQGHIVPDVFVVQVAGWHIQSLGHRIIGWRDTSAVLWILEIPHQDGIGRGHTASNRILAFVHRAFLVEGPPLLPLGRGELVHDVSSGRCLPHAGSRLVLFDTHLSGRGNLLFHVLQPLLHGGRQCAIVGQLSIGRVAQDRTSHIVASNNYKAAIACIEIVGGIV